MESFFGNLLAFIVCAIFLFPFICLACTGFAWRSEAQEELHREWEESRKEPLGKVEPRE
jgi:hypothetical protein